MKEIYYKLQEMLDNHLPFMSGKTITEAKKDYYVPYGSGGSAITTEDSAKADYFCCTKSDTCEKKLELLPFGHLRERNIIKFDNVCKATNESIFRNNTGIALMLETPDNGDSYEGKATLTIITMEKPSTLLSLEEYRFEKLARWKYKSSWIENLDIYLIVLQEIKDQEGEALAPLQKILAK